MIPLLKLCLLHREEDRIAGFGIFFGPEHSHAGIEIAGVYNIAGYVDSIHREPVAFKGGIGNAVYNFQVIGKQAISPLRSGKSQDS